ncbi:hypothetical protein BRADI_3g30651v3 [Brachypodium distachyon]|uniref:Uncharacterized protein n=1 Tax=Brachypodium distachyon TaxID=15368 RepID=A0A2K2D080_BRADI|nr:hypothetical protein BRADI_3g30651v3 [Brachypodium distachyon]
MGLTATSIRPVGFGIWEEFGCGGCGGKQEKGYSLAEYAMGLRLQVDPQIFYACVTTFKQ